MKTYTLLSLAAAAGVASANVRVFVGSDTDSARATGTSDSGNCNSRQTETITSWADCQTAVLEGLQTEYNAPDRRMLRRALTSQINTGGDDATAVVGQDAGSPSPTQARPSRNFWKAHRSTADDEVVCSGSGNNPDIFASAAFFRSEDSNISGGGCDGDGQRATFGYNNYRVTFAVETPRGYRQGNTAQVHLQGWTSGYAGTSCVPIVDASPDGVTWHENVASFGGYTGFAQEVPSPTFTLPFRSDASNSLYIRYRHDPEGRCNALIYVKEAGARVARADLDAAETQIELEEEEREQDEQREELRAERVALRAERVAQREEKARVKELKRQVRDFRTESDINAKVRNMEHSGRPYGCIKMVGRKVKYFFNTAEDMAAQATNDYHIVCQLSQ